MQTIYQPSGMSPYNVCQDLSLPCLFSAQINGISVDAYNLVIKDLDNLVLYNSGSSISIPNSDIGITYSGTWTTATNKIIDDTNQLIQYYGNGWATLTSTTIGYYNGSIHNSSTANDYSQLTFTGTGIECFFTEGIDKGIFQVYIDGVDKGTVDTYTSIGVDATGNIFKVKAYSVSNLSYGSHTIKILVLGTKNSSSANTRIEIDYVNILNTNGSKNCSSAGSYVQYTFTSNGIDVYMDMTPDSGTVQILIDGIDQGTIDLYSPTYNMSYLAYSNTNLTYASHIIKIMVTGNKNAQSSNSFVYFESLKTTNKTNLTTMLYDKQLFSFTLPANTIVQKGAMKWQLTIWNSVSNGENVSSGEMIFTNESTPTATLNAPATITGKSFTFASAYAQAENIPIKKYNYSLYAINYTVDEGYFGQPVTGTVVDEGNFGAVNNGLAIDEGIY